MFALSGREPPIKEVKSNVHSLTIVTPNLQYSIPSSRV